MESSAEDKTMARWTRILTLTICAMSSAACFGDGTINRSFEGVDSVDLDLRSADAIVSRGSSGKVTVTIRHTYDEDRYRPVLEQTGSRVQLREKFAGRWPSRGHATWTVTIPDDSDFTAELGSGNLDMQDLSVNLRASLGSGDMNVERFSGKARISGGSGDLDMREIIGEVRITQGSGDATVQQLKGDLRCSNGSGKIHVSGTAGDVELSNGSGGIELSDVEGSYRITDGSGDIRGSDIRIKDSSSFRSGSGDVRFREAHIAADVRLQSGSGDTKLVLGDSPKGDLSLSSGSGDAVVDFSGHKITGTIVMRADKRHGRIEAPFKFDREYEEGYDDYDRTMVKEVTLGNGKPVISISTGSGTAAIVK